MLNIFHAIILGVVEGLTEFLPISSTAHLVLASRLLDIAQSDYVKSFEIVIQSGAILSVVALYWRRFLDWETLKKLAIAFLPTGVLGLVFYSFLKAHVLGNLAIMFWTMGVGGAFLILLEKFFFAKRAAAAVATETRDLSYGKCVALGFFQAIAMIPGVSRSAATIVGGMLLGINRRAIVEFSFLLAVPTMAAATGLDLLKSAGSWSSGQVNVLVVGFLVSFATAFVAIRWLLKYVQRHDFVAFGVYRILIVLAFLALWR